MKTLLLVNACVQRETSRTDRLCRTWLRENRRAGCDVEEVVLEEEQLRGLDTQMLAERNRLLRECELTHVMFRYARQFCDADEIVIAAPYWDLSFPAALKCYLEAVSVVGLTFRYREDGAPEGLCRAKRLTYITTSGGFIGANNFGYDYVKALAALFGIAEIQMVSAEGLDIAGADAEHILQQAEQCIRSRCVHNRAKE